MSLKDKAIRIKDWCKDHKKEIIIATISVAGCGAVCYGTKKTIGLLKASKEQSLEQYNQAVEAFEVGMFVNGARKQFLDAGADDCVSDIKDSVVKLKNIVQGEDALSAVRFNDKILVITQGVAADHGGDVVDIVKDAFPGIDDLEIWVGGTIEE